MIKTKKGFLLRNLGEEYIVVAIGEASKDFNGMIRLNKTGAFYWKELENGTTEGELVRKTLEHFSNLNEEVVRSDVKDFLDKISMALDYDKKDN